MKCKFPPLYAVLIGAGLLAASPRLSGQPAPPAATNALGPRMTFATTEFNFGKVMMGEVLKYVFMATNTGDQILVISNVVPGCHCTTVGDWTKAHQIEPGQTGEIPIQFDTHGLHGSVSRAIKVASNDKLAPIQNLSVRGTVLRAINVHPDVAFIHIKPDATSNSTVVVHISNELEKPLTLSDPASSNPSFKPELQTLIPGKEFTMVITAIPPFPPGRTAGTVTVKTSFTNMPVISVTAYAVVQRAVNAAHPP